jgi:uncharacterized iron-regulated membrane protein
MGHAILKWILPIVAALAVVGSAAAQGPRSGPDLDRAISRARATVPGRVLSAETQHRGGHREHHIRILTPDGRVRRLYVDGQSGEVSGTPRGPR